MKADRPEVNQINHQIALVGGSTIALETTCARLQKAKIQPTLPASEREGV